MTRTLHLHIGAHRTATTSIQAFLRSNFFALQRKGVFVPYAAGRHFDLINRLFDGRTSVDEAAADINQRADAKSFELRDIVISDEDICMRRDLSPLAELRDHYDVRVVFALRRQDVWLESWHQQNVKWQWDPGLAHLTFPEFLDRRAEFFWIDYQDRLTHLESLFGAENIRLTVFEPGQMPGGPVAAFCEAIGLTDTDGLDMDVQRNRSMSPLMSEFMRTLPLDEVPGPQRKIMERACGVADQSLRRNVGSQGALLMDHETRQTVLAEYTPGNTRIAQGRFGRDALFLDPVPGADSPLAPQTLPADSYETIRLIVAPVLQAFAIAMMDAAEDRKVHRKKK